MSYFIPQGVEVYPCFIQRDRGYPIHPVVGLTLFHPGGLQITTGPMKDFTLGPTRPLKDLEKQFGNLHDNL